MAPIERYQLRFDNIIKHGFPSYQHFCEAYILIIVGKHYLPTEDYNLKQQEMGL